MNITRLEDSDLLIIEPSVFSDHRGTFMETFNEAVFRLKTGLNITFVQDNQSTSHSNVFRGLHFQIPPKSQAKLIRVSQGSIIDFAVDLRKSSPHFGRCYQMEISAANHLQFYIPEGFAHGFLALAQDTIVQYKCSHYYSPDSERSLYYLDPALELFSSVSKSEWIVSEKDQQGQVLSELSDYFF
jgi:dTDP-4-dehydrorhamnose 3,5-epimerase